MGYSCPPTYLPCGRKAFLQTRIKEQDRDAVRHPADLASGGGQTTELWWNAPRWLANQEEWLPNPETPASSILEEEAKTT